MLIIKFDINARIKLITILGSNESEKNKLQNTEGLIVDKVRHPEKVKNNTDLKVLRKPDWIRVKFKQSKGFNRTKEIIRENNLNTVCEEAACPNISECWSQGHATMMIMGEICTRGCSFCNVITGKPEKLDIFEPGRVAFAVKKMELSHVVITSVDRDDLPDGGAQHIAQTIKAIRQRAPETTIEVLTPDFLRCKNSALEEVVQAKPDVFNHNLETVPGLYPSVRPGARYFSSLRLLQRVKEIDPEMFTKSGLMVGLGEQKSEIYQVMDDMISASVDFITIGQYLQPTRKHLPVERFLSPKEFDALYKIAVGKGFLMVSSSPLTRSSYHAGDTFKKMQLKRKKLYSL